jgi:galactarate dehydratase
VTLPLSKLIVGMQCGGSDAFSGITANPARGYASDMLVNAGATVLFSEVTEIRDAVYILAARAPSRDIRDALIREMRWYDDYLERGGADRSANTTPGNKKGGLSNIVEKALGSIAKSGFAPIAEVIGPGERPTRHGLIYAATPASDIVCGPMQLTSGITLQVFMTGGERPTALPPRPSSRFPRRGNCRKWKDLIDINAGSILSGEATIEQVALRYLT